ncbi:MBG domain-containing protein, partial [Geofilum sp. OHC36d9]|uniref:MBG domain-containing protein n=1 Tax=Geofilum sp. OHC36d9 TaxID=3458413 RepID=UPI004033815F
TQGDLSLSSNYDLSFESADFSINPKAITVTADAGQSKTYGEVDPVLTYTVSPSLIEGDAFSGSISREAGEDAEMYAITQGDLSAGSNYDVTFESADFEIKTKAITVTADAGQSKTYGESDPVLTYTVSPSLIEGDAFSGALSREAGEDAEMYAITQGDLSAGSNYALSFESADFEIKTKAITVTADAGQSKTYGEADPVLTYMVSPSLVDGDAFSGALSREAGEAAGMYAITLGDLSLSSNYDLSFESADFSINPKAITVTADAGQSKTYGEADPVLTYTVSSSLIDGDAFSGALSREAGEAAGTYAITLGDLSASLNYALSFESADFEIKTKAITVTADAGQSKTYGEVDPVLTYTVSPSLVDGDAFSGALSREAGEAAGTYAITLGDLSAGSNYALSFESADFSINPKAITVTADGGQSKTYGEADPVLTYTVSPSLVDGDAFSGSLSREAGEAAGMYAITQGDLSLSSNYDLSFESADFEIKTKAITVTADAGQSKTYGEADPVLTYTVSPSLVDGDAFSGALSREAGEGAEMYAITQGDLSLSSNYDLSFESADFEIKTKAITVTADAGQSKTYGEVDPVLTYTVSPSLIEGDAFSGSLSREAGEAAGTYAISLGDLSVGSNYDVTFESVGFDITKAGLIVTVDDQIITQGSEIPEFNIIYSGFVNGDTESDLDEFPTASATATSESEAGEYVITVSGGSDNNYDLIYVEGTLTISPSTATHELSAETISVYPNPATTVITVTGSTGVASLYSLDGTKVLVQDLSHSNSINISALPSGLYLLSVDGIIIKVVIK